MGEACVMPARPRRGGKPGARPQRECPPGPSGLPERRGAAPAPERLPSLQRNALCKFFERPDFTPADVVALGHGRLLKINGIGPKGIQVIVLWLRHHGLCLDVADGARAMRQVQRVERAIRLLERHGYEVKKKAAPAGSVP